MKIVLITTSLLGAALAEWSSAGFSFGGIPPPFFLATVSFWFLRLKMRERMFLGILAGLFLDGISSFSFGTYTAALFLLSLLAEVVLDLFSPRESLGVYSSSLALLVFLVLFLLPLFFSPQDAPYFFASAIFWGLLTLGFFGGFGRLARRALHI